ncbi:MAG: S9 family peptidase [Desulfobacterales bacterium]|nr:S9 family peptidase [Desulfobacterales bacterium]
MSEKKTSGPRPRPNGSWKSPISSDMAAAGVVTFKDVAVDNDDVYWVECRPDEEGRHVVVRYAPDGETRDVTPRGFSARTIIYSYGGGAVEVSDGVVYFTNYDLAASPASRDQRVFRQAPGMRPAPITSRASTRYGDGVIDKKRNRLIIVKEDCTTLVDGYPEGTIVGLDADGEKEAVTLASGADFYSSPCLSPDGGRLAWLSWDFPHMPWDSNELWVADMAEDGSIRGKRRIAGDTSRMEPDESTRRRIEERGCKTAPGEFLQQPQALFQPRWSPDGKHLYFVSDLDNWWNIYRVDIDGIERGAEMITVNAPERSEFGAPRWVLGMSTYAFLSDATIIAAFTRSGEWRLAIVDVDSKDFKEVKVELAGISGVKAEVTDISHVRAAASGKVVFIAGSPDHPASVVLFDPKSGACKVLRPGIKDMKKLSDVHAYFSRPRPVEYPTGSHMKETAHAFYYPPGNPDYETPEGEKPPLLLLAHGGPTSAAATTLSMTIQYFTSRGFAAADVNYRGSSGFGRKYRLSLYSNWGVYDRDDCVHCARYLAAMENGIDPGRVLARGGSAGGYLTLALATYTDLLKGGASYYGVSDLIALLEHTHKFEAQYLATLVGPYPEERKRFMLRSPIHVLDLLDTPLIFFQGSDDPVVPPEQSIKMVNAMKEKGVPVAYIEYPNEQHGFRIAEDIKGSLEAEFYFYSQMLDFEPADESPPVEIDNWEGAV